MSSRQIWRVAGNMEKAQIIWQVAGKVIVQVAGKSKISYIIWRLAGKYGKWHDNMVSGRKKYEFTVDLASGKKYGQCQNYMGSGRKSKVLVAR